MKSEAGRTLRRIFSHIQLAGFNNSHVLTLYLHSQRVVALNMKKTRRRGEYETKTNILFCQSFFLFNCSELDLNLFI